MKHIFYLFLLLIFFSMPVYAIERPERPETPQIPKSPDTPEFPPLERIEFVHFPRRERVTPQPTNAPIITPGCPNPDGCNEYSLSRYKWSDPNGSDDLGLPYFVNTTAVPNGISANVFEGVLRSSFTVWESTNTSGKLKYRAAGVTTKAPRVQDFVNTIGFADISKQYRGALAVTTVWYRTDTKSIVEFDMTFNTAAPWKINDMPVGCTEYPANSCVGNRNAYDVQNVAVHEIGHTLMLLDLSKSRQRELTMYGSALLGELKKRTLGLGDRTAVNTIYP